jgi:hypothetical protein
MSNDNLVDVLTPIHSGDGEAAREAFKKAVEGREPFYKPEKSGSREFL